MTEYEKLSCDAGLSIEQWLIDNVPLYEPLPVPLYSVLLNGLEVAPELWEKTQLEAGNLLEFFIEPKEPVTIAMVVIAVVSAAAAIYYANQIPDNYNSTTPNGSSVYDANAQGNRVRLMGVVPEHLGEHLNYPDVLNTPRQHYQNDESWKYFLLCVGQGEYQINDTDIFIGNTQVSRYAGDIEYQLFGPGGDVSGNEAHRNFYQSPEVGGNGLEVDAPPYKFIAQEGLGSSISTTKSYTANQTKLDVIAFFGGSGGGYGDFPWSVGDDIQLDAVDGTIEIYEGVVDLVDKGDLNPDQITAPFGLDVVTAGQKIQLAGAGDNDGTYLVKTATATELELTDEAGLDVTWFVPAERVLVRILREHSILGLYHAEAAYASNGILVSKVGEPTWPGFDAYGIYTNISAELIDDTIVPVAVGPFSAAPAAEVTNLIELDFMFDGLGRLNNDGTVSAHSVDIEIQYREIGTQAWTKSSHTFSEATRDQFGRTIVISLPSKIAVEVQVERVSRQEDNIALNEKVIWKALRAELDTVTSYPGMTTLALKVKGSNALSASAENKINVIATRKLTTFDASGNLTQFEATRDIAPAVYQICLSAGYAADQIDLDELYRLHQIWAARGDEFNAIFDNEITVWEALKRVLAVGFAKPTLDYGKIIPVRDEKRESLNYMYQADNMIKNSWKMNATLIDESESDGIEVEYFSIATRKPETIMCLLPGQLGLKPERVRAFGITNIDKAYQFGMRMASIRKWRRKEHTWSTEMDGLNSNYLSYDALGIDIPGFSQTGRVEAVAGRVIKVNQDLNWVTGTNYIGIRNAEGKLSGPYTCTRGTDVDTVVLDADLDFVPVMDGSQEPPLFMFGSDTQWCERVLVTDIKPSGTDRVKLKGINDDDRVYLYDDALAPVEV